ncbi:MAG: TonB-dependent receptor plug domain-containing protein [Bacteroidales bacterium]|nr:TonB-dependent receptor plug domain-containing protein [Bacteroidales bacterium]
MILRNAVFYIALFLSPHLYGQMSLNSDTILIREVIISGISSAGTISEAKTVEIDSSEIAGYRHHTISDLISEKTTLYIKSYGPGGISTPSLRGTSAGHTQISWNGVNLNNPMLGQFDLSLVPAGMIDGIGVFMGGGSLEMGSGGMGGIINLETQPDWSDKTSIMVNPGIGSFGKYSGLARINTGGARLHSSTRAYYQKSENDFRFLNTSLGPNPEWERRENSQFNQRGVIQEIYLKASGNTTLSGRFWYQSANRNMPVPITVPTLNPPEKQYDESFRSMVNIETTRKETEYKITGAYISDYLHYTNQSASTDSRNLSRNAIFRASISKGLGNSTRFRFDFNDEINLINSNNYISNRIRNLASAGLISETELNKKISARISIRENLVDRKLLVPDFSVSTTYDITRSGGHHIKLGISKNSRIPSLNDMYWSPGGNPDLKTETGYLSELSWIMKHNFCQAFSARTVITLFRSRINNLIQWIPGNSSYWVAANSRKSRTTGLETGIDLRYSKSDLYFNLKADYALTKAFAVRSEGNDESSDRQLIYVPVHKMNSVLKINWKFLHSSIGGHYVGRRFINPDNTSYLPGYIFSNLESGIQIKQQKMTYDIILSVNNVFNTRYQNVAWYPMPGRSFFLSVVLLLN